MATLERKTNKDGTHRYTIRFTVDDEDKSISFGSRYGEKIREYRRVITDIVQSVETYGREHPLKKSIRAYIEENPELKMKLKRAGLIEVQSKSTLSALWDMLDEHAKKMGYKDSTLKQYKSARKWFFSHFEEAREIGTITEKDAEEFRAWLERQNNKYGNPISPRSIAGYVKTIKAVFNLARKARIIDRSPFEFIKKGSFANPARQFEVRVDIISAILDACPNQSWRTMFALWRFGGLRKMEPFYLKWEDILWSVGKIRVHSPKTERYEGHAERFCPLFPEIRQELEDLSELAEPKAVYVFPDDIRGLSESALYNKTRKIVQRAGFTPWEKLIVNMRATRVSELKRAGVSSDLRQAFFGHDESVSAKHYQIADMLVSNEDYARVCSLKTLQSEQSNFQPETVLETVLETR